MDMKKKRDEGMEAIGQPSVEGDGPGNMGLPQDAKEEQPKNKSKLKHKEDQVVHIDVAGKSIQLLCPSFRLERAGLQVSLNSDHLEPVFKCLHGGISPPSASKDQAPQEVEGWHIVVWLFQIMKFSMVQVQMVEPHAKFTMCMQAPGLRCAISFPNSIGMTIVLHLVAAASPNGCIASRSKWLPTGKNAMAEIVVQHPQKPWHVRMHLDPEWHVATFSSPNKSDYQSGLHHSTRSVVTLVYMVPWNEFQHCVAFILATRESFSASL